MKKKYPIIIFLSVIVLCCSKLSGQYLETAVKAANWIHVGTTQGRGRDDRFKKAALPKKDIYIYPIQRDFQKILC